MAPLLRQLLGRMTGNFPAEEVARRVQAPPDFASGQPLFMPGKPQVVFFDAHLNVVEEDRALYELHLRKNAIFEWKKRGGTSKDKYPFSIAGYFNDWAHEESANYPYNLTRKFINDLMADPSSGCSLGFRWVSTDWPTRYRHSLATHRGSLDECEKVFVGLAYSFDCADNTHSATTWTINVQQSQYEPTNPALWSHIKRDCELVVNGTLIEFTDRQYKLIRLVHCYFMPFCKGDGDHAYPWPSDSRKTQGILWRFDVPSASYHERLESLLHLREWLHGKAPVEDIPVLLGDC